MENNKISLSWWRIIVGGILPYILTGIFISIIVFIYALKLGLEVRGEPDNEKIQQFAQYLGVYWSAWIGSTVMTFLSVFLLLRKLKGRWIEHALYIGGLEIILVIFLSIKDFDLSTILFSMLSILFVWIGGKVAERDALKGIVLDSEL